MAKLLKSCLLIGPVISLFAAAPALAEVDLSTIKPLPQDAIAAAPAAPAATADTDHMASLFELSYDDAAQAVSKALTEKGVADKVSATINGAGDAPLFSYTKPITVAVKGLTFDKASGNWRANLLAMSGSDVVTALPAGGRFSEMVEVPVLKRDVRSGDVISQADIEIRDFAVARTRTDTVTDMASLIGKSPGRTITAGRPIHTHEVAEPMLVKKNSMVSMHYDMPGMEISATGQAMEDGAKGGSIAVKNLSSKKVVRATVIDASTVSVATVDMTVPSAQTQTPGQTYAQK